MSNQPNAEEQNFTPLPKRAELSDAIFSTLAMEDPQERIEAQELRQIVHRALQELTPEQLKVIELRYQHKKSPGQITSMLQITRQQMKRREKKGLDKIRQRLQAWYLDQ